MLHSCTLTLEEPILSVQEPPTSITMRFSTSTLLALLASLAAAASLDTPEASNLNTTTASDLTPAVERDSDILGGDAVGLSLEGLAPCYVSTSARPPPSPP